MAKNQIRMIPVKRDTGEMLRYVRSSYEQTPDGDTYFKWIPNNVWSDTMRIVGMERGQSAAGFITKSENTEKEYYMFVKDMLDMILNNTIQNGKISGFFTYVQRGRNYGLKCVNHMGENKYA